MNDPSQPTQSSPAKNSKRVGVGTRVMRVIAALSLGAALVWIGFWVNDLLQPPKNLFQLGQKALAEKDYATADKYARRLLSRESSTNEGLVLAGMIAASTDQADKAIELLSQVPDDGSVLAGEAHSNIAYLLLNHYKQPHKALQEFAKAHSQQRELPNPYSFISYILRLGTRIREMTEFDVWIARYGGPYGLLSPERLYNMSLGHGLHTDENRIEDLRRESPDDPIVRLGLADIALYRNRDDEAAEHYRFVIDTHPAILEAHVRMGQVYMKANQDAKIPEWKASLPAAADQHPLTWSILGDWAEKQGQPKAAIRCFWEAVRLDPNHLPALYRLGQLLIADGKREVAAPFVTRAILLQEYVSAIHTLKARKDKPPVVDQLLKPAGLAFQLGLLAESNGWILLAVQLDPQLKQGLTEIKGKIDEQLKEAPLVRVVDASFNPALAVDLSGNPLPDFAAIPSQPTSPVSESATQVTFADVAKEVGIDFSYFKGGDPKIPGLTRVYRFNGGGVAVLDYDCDGWPDIYLTQGAETPQDAAQTDHLDKLFRNTGDGRFEDVTASAGIVENSYSQGATVGDFNCDGFPDLYVANIGGNRLYRNNGDGTFDDVSAPSETAGSQWTSSCLMADVNGDALPDIYEVNYLEGENVFTTVCRDEKGKHHACMPLQFASAMDKLYLNKGDGTFKDVSKESGIEVLNGKGLGIVAADFAGTGKLNLFVANDGVPNFYFVNETPDASGFPKFIEQAVLHGLAYNRNGTAQAGMGVAAGDSNADGLLDLVVTNFYAETCTLYRQQPDHLFADETEVARLADPTRNMLGFGTQFLDGALRGTEDLVMTNGHIDNLDAENVPYEMPPQYFTNRGDGTFAELPAVSIGPYFEGKYLGRGLARLDWNRDGKEDVAISHLDAPAALLSNTTKDAGHFITVRLVGVKTSRDAIGTTLTLQAGGKTQVKQLTAGDGFESSNERIIIFGLGEATAADSLEVRWLSGEKQQFPNVAADGEYLCIEGAGDLVKLAR